MNLNKLLQKQISKFLPAELRENKDLQRFFEVIGDSYSALQRDVELSERAFSISEGEYEALNKKLKQELELKKLSVNKLNETVSVIKGEESHGASDDLLLIADYLKQQVGKRKSAEEVFVSLVNNSQSAILLEDEDRKIVFTNQLFCDLFQIPVAPESLQGVDCNDSAEQSKHLFADPEDFVTEIDRILIERTLHSRILNFADGRILKREYIPIFIENEYKGHLWSYADITEKYSIQEAIEQSELKNRLIMNSALDAIITIDAQGIITFWNPQAEKVFGWKENEVLGKKLSDTIIPDYHKKGHDSGMEHYHLTGEGPALNKLLELPAVNIHGKEFPIEFSIIPVKQGDTEFFCSFIRDISDRKKSEEALKASKELWQFALEGTGDGVIEYNLQTREVFFSKQYLKMLGFEEGEFSNQISEWLSRVHPEDHSVIVQLYKDYLEKGIKSHQKEYRIRQKNGEYIWILDRGMIVTFTEDQKPIRLIATHSDITERKLSEQALKIKEEKYRSILANMNLGLLEVDNDDIIQFANNSFCLMSGYHLDELIGEKAADLFLEKKRKEVIFNKNAQRKVGISDTFEIPVLNKKGENKWWLISGAPRYDDSGKLVGSIGIHLDITAQKKLEIDLTMARDAAQASTEAKETFLANMSHEIRTPMNAILGMANQLNKTKLNANQNFFLNTIQSSADNLLVIINDVLDLSKIDSGKLSIENIGFEPSRVIEHVMRVMQHRAEEKGLKFTNSFFDDGISAVLLGDPYRLSQVLLNLVSNAIKFTNSGTIDVSCKVLVDYPEKQLLQATVSDTGIGMEIEFIDKIFEKFSQEDDSVSRKYGGTGLGMSISKELVELMGGKISVVSTKNEGTSVSFILGMQKGTGNDLPQKETIETNTDILEGKNILVTDDNEINRLIASTILKNFGARIFEATNGQEAIDMIKSNSIDIVLMDVQMPVMDGINATEFIREHVSKTLPIIALTAFALKGDNQKCFDAGMNDYLSKPFEESQLLQMVSKWLGKNFNNTEAGQQQTTDIQEQLYDMSELKLIARGDTDFLLKMTRLFIDQTPVAIQEMISAYDAADYRAVKEIAHRIKPSIDNMGIITLKEPIREIEKFAETYKSAGKLETLITEVDMVVQSVVRQLRKIEF
jgi:PAS domain S-box-containing protein